MVKISATEIVSGVSGESKGNIRDVFEQAVVRLVYSVCGWVYGGEGE